MIRRLRELQGFKERKAFAVLIGIKYERYQMIERMLKLATREEFEAIGGDNYEMYLSEFNSKRTFDYTSSLVKFASFCGCLKPEQCVKEWNEINNK